jgi:hypothetical protein
LQLAFASNSDHTDALAHAAATLADVTQQLQVLPQQKYAVVMTLALQMERDKHAVTAEKLRAKNIAFAALSADARSLKELATQSRRVLCIGADVSNCDLLHDNLSFSAR